MNTERLLAGSLALLVLSTLGRAQAPLPLPTLDDKPFPQVDARGPAAAVTALAFSADGETLYAAGLDKVVRVWTLQRNQFVLKTTYRVPVGPGNTGAVNAVALSPDGTRLAMAGRAPMRGEAGFRLGGVIVETTALAAEQNLDAGIIYVASTGNPAGGRVLRGHRGEVRALAFAPASNGKPLLLVSAASERSGARHFGGLRLWDVTAGKVLAERTDLPATADRPGLAVWHSGPETTQVRVAVAWPEEDAAKPSYLRVWDTHPGAEALQGWEDDRSTRTVALLGQDNGVNLLTGGFTAEFGRLRVWQLSADRKIRSQWGAEVRFPRSGAVRFRPVSLAIVSAGGGAPSHAAVVLQPSGNEDFRLALIDLHTNRVVAEVPLRNSDRTQLPAIAVRGKRLAVAAVRDHAVRVYAVADLLQGKVQPEAVLTGDGLSPRRVAFVDGGRGIWLSDNERARPLSNGLLFDLDKRRLRANDRVDLLSDVPEPGDWSFAIGADRKSVTVRQGQRELPPVRLHGKEDIVTEVALRPPAPGRSGVLAVAYTERDSNRVLIMLCDPADGKPYRLLISHLQDVRQLAFSASRPLLASVADDQTVCIWSLADLDRAVGRVGGMEVADEGGKHVVLRRVEPGSAAAKAGLVVGDRLEKVASPGGAGKPVKDAADFLLAVAAHRPGDQVELIVAGKGAVRLLVERGVDERKPLFSLFLVRTPQQPEWVGWSPAGPYDSSNPVAEEHLGWHTNTGDPAAPVAYVAARAYRKDYYREGILRYLAGEADLGRALQKWDGDHPSQPPRPSLRPLPPQGALPLERANTYLVRQAVKALSVGINEDYALDDKHVLRWRLTRTDEGKAKPDTAARSGQAVHRGTEWQVDLSSVAWQRGTYQLRLGLHAHANGPELAAETVTLRFQPPAPAVALRLGEKTLKTTERQPLNVMEDKLTLQVALQALRGQQVQVQFALSRNGLPQNNAPAPHVQVGSGVFPQEFQLQDGLNRLAVRAINKEALKGHEDEESAVAEVWVSYKVPHELPPRFTALRLEPEPEVQRIGGKELWVVSKPTARLTAKIEGVGVLVRADWSAGGMSQSVLPAQAVKAIDVAANLELKAGRPTPVRLWAKSKFSDANTLERWVVFYPPLPAVTTDPLRSPEVFTEKLLLTGTFQAAPTDPFSVRFRISSPDGKVKSLTPQVDPKARTWKVELPLFPGSNTVEAFVANPWRGEQAVGGTLNLRYRRPPQITACPKEVEAIETNKVKLAVIVQGPAGQPLTAFKGNENFLRFEANQPETQGDRWIWKVVLPEVFVNDGDRDLDQIAIRAVSDEGESQPAVIRVVHKQLPHPPHARFLSPLGPDTARRPDYRATFRVESEKPLERVEIRCGSALLYQADLSSVEREGKRYVLQAEASVVLHNGENRLELVAVNTDGRSPRAEAEAVVSYTEPAVLVIPDRIELLENHNDAQQVLEAGYLPNGDVTFPSAAPQSVVWLVGRVRWSDPKAKALDDRSLELVATVGDCQQFPVALGLRGQGEQRNVRPFRVPLVLIGAANKIKIEVPSVSQQELSRREFELACSNPVKHQRLHLLIIGVEVQDAMELKQRVLDALAADPKSRPKGVQGPFSKNPPFEQCVLYHVLVGDIDRGKVEAQLVQINNVIKQLQRETGWMNDVVLIYYQGEDVELPEKKERWLKTSRNFQFPEAPVQAFAIPCHALRRVPGAQLLLLNVPWTPAAQVAGADWGGDPDTGFLRYACHDRADVRKANPALLSLLQEAIRKNGRLGEVVQYINKLLGQQPARFSPLIVLDDHLASRQINEPR
jgi:WD40 repeat protein